MRNHSNYDNLFVKCICRDHTFSYYSDSTILSYEERTRFTETTLVHVHYTCSKSSSNVSASWTEQDITEYFGTVEYIVTVYHKPCRACILTNKVYQFG